VKNTRYFTLNFTGFSTAASEKQSYLRLIAGDYIFYTDTRYFQDPALFKQLKINQPLHIGAHRLPDGSFWIHWLSDGNVLLEPARPPLKGKLLAFFIGALAFIASASPAYFYFTAVWAVIAFGVIAAIALGVALVALCGLVHRVAQTVHPDMRALWVKIEQARRGDVSFCQTVASAVRHSAPSFPDHTPLPERFSVEEGIANNLYFKKWSTGAGKTHRDYHGIAFQCGGVPLAFFWQFSGTRWGLHPIFYRCHPPFLASGDRITAVYRQDNGDVQVLCNHSDGCAYLKNHPLYPGEQQMSLIYKIFYSFALLASLFILGLELSDMLASGWDSWKFAADALDMLALLLLCVGGILIFLELCCLAIRQLSSRVGDWVMLQRITKRDIACAKANAVLQELM
jgi:hypothetical protein